MKRRFLVVILSAAIPLFVHASLDPAQIISPGIAAGGTPVNVVPTFYGPGASGNMQGGFVTSRPNREGSNIPRTLDDVRLGRSQYVTLASAAANYNKWYQIPMIQYRSPIDGQWYTMQNVVGYVHDTGCAFNGTCPNFGGRIGMFSSQPRPDKFDIAVGDFRGRSDAAAMGIVSGSTASRTWLQIGGPVGGTVVAANPYLTGSPYGNVGGANPYTVGYPTGQYAGSSAPSGQGSGYCIVSIEPVIVYPRGSVPDSMCYNQFSQQPPPPPPPPQQAQASPYQSQPIPSNPLSYSMVSQQPLPPSGTGSLPPLPPRPAVTLIAQPTLVRKGNTVLIAWSSVGVRGDGCTLRNGEVFLEQKNEGTKIISGAAQSLGVMTFRLTCTPLVGPVIEKSASVTIVAP